MRFCDEHWAALRFAIADCGLAHLVARSAEEATAAVKRQLAGKATKADYDPLAAATWAIYNQYLGDQGMAAMLTPVCPLCEVEKSKAGLAANWVSGSTTEQLIYARELGLAPRVQ